jgi:hypothetical protein
MRSRQVFLASLFLLSITVSARVVSLRSQDQEHRSLGGQKTDREPSRKLPVADYDSQEPQDPEERARRHEKNKKYNTNKGVKFDPSSPTERGALHNNWERGLESTLPVRQSSAVIVGEVVRAQAYLSEDKTNVYSEFAVRVSEVLKDDTEGAIAVGDLIVVERQGGRVRYASGRTETQAIAGQGAPQPGRQYVLFLGFNPYEAGTKSLTGPLGDMRRHILTGYELSEGKVLPLDTAGDFDEHRNKEVTVFLNELRRASSPAAGPSDK